MSRSARTARAVLLVLVVVLAGCGGVEPTDEPTETPTSAATTQSVGTLSVHFINVGQSVSTLVVGPTGETMLIDTGHYNDDGAHVLAYLERHDVTRLDHLVVSHNDADHIGGNAAIIDYYEREADGVGAVYDPGIAASTQTYERYLDAVEEHDVTLYETREGDSVPFEGVNVAVLGPPEPYLENRARNENSIVLKLTHGETSVLLSGDAEDDQEAYLVETYGDRLRSTVLKAGHHGSSSSSSGAFLDAVQPNAVVVSSAYDSRYGHPTDEVLRRFADRSLPTYWTATHGDIVLVSDGSEVSVRTQQAAPTDPLDLREGDAIDPGNHSPVVERVRLEGEAVTTRTEPIATDGGTATASALAVSAINADAAGPDRENLDDEYVVFENTGEGRLDLSGWTVADEAGRTYTFPDGYTLEAGEMVTLRTGAGTDTDDDLYWGAGSPIWNNDGDTVIVRNSDGTPVLRETYP
ncbi:MAG: lamin tail domain-containing protein [Haloplanus sp.]